MAVEMLSPIEVHELVTNMIEMLVEKLEISPLQILVGVHNAFVHGDIFANMATNAEIDEHLPDFFDGLDKAAKAVEKIMGE